MNSEDFVRGMNRNVAFEAKQQARADAIYEAERRKYDNKYNNANTQQQQQVNNIPSDIYNRLNRIEGRIDRLYELIGQGNNQQSELERVSGKLFVFAPTANINANQAITLTDEQFSCLIGLIMK